MRQRYNQQENGEMMIRYQVVKKVVNRYIRPSDQMDALRISDLKQVNNKKTKEMLNGQELERGG